MKKIRTTLDNDKLTCRVLLEFQKAFDIVNHKVRTFEFEYHDIRGIVFDWSKSYLTNRLQQKWIKDVKSRDQYLEHFFFWSTSITSIITWQLIVSCPMAPSE